MTVSAIVVLCSALFAQAQTGTLAAEVRLPDGRPAPSVGVLIRAPGGGQVAETSTDAGGRLHLPLPPGRYLVAVREERDVQSAIEAEVRAGQETMVELVAMPPRRETITVTATVEPRPAATVPSSVTVLEGARVRNAPAVTVDDALRSVPGFSLFRRTSSLAAHPTAQGVSLRGVGPSGASRSLVLLDGFPLNDPFGGWVYWSRIPKEAIEAIEILRGAASSLYGDAALSGVVAVTTEHPQANLLRASLSGGSLGIADASWLAGTRFGGGRWGAAVDGEAFRDDGYFLLRERDRGAVDTRASLAYTAARARLERSFSGGSRLAASAGMLTEDRHNGTLFQTNSTDLRYGSLSGEAHTAGGSVWRAGVLAMGETFRSTFSSVAANRSRETPTLHQRVPSNSVTGHLDWSRTMGPHFLVAGGDLRWVQGDSIERSLLRNTLAVLGGSERLGGVFLQDVFSPAPRLQVVASARVDCWTGTERHGSASSSATVVNPQLGIRFQATGKLALRAQGYRGFRAPTLNELYRAFQVGNILTQANAALRPERTNGAEAGVDVQAGRGLLRVTAFWTDLRDPVANLTVSATVRRRENIGAAQVRGLEADWDWRPSARTQFRASYLLDDATVRRFVPDASLEGRRLPQVPRHAGSMALGISAPRGGMLTMDARLAGVQFDDDRNLLPLAGFGDVGVAFTQPLRSGFEAFVHAANLFDRRYPVARTPLENLSAPRVVLVGIRFRSQR